MSDAPSVWDELAGPFVTVEYVALLRGETPDDVYDHAINDEILLLNSHDGSELLPKFQFGPGGELLPGLPQVIAELRRGMSDQRVWAQWLNSRPESRGTASHAERVRAGELDYVLRAARATASSWST